MSNRRVNVSRLIDEAFASHQKGELDRAADLYSQVLRERHDHFDSLHMLGVIRSQQNRHSEAIHLIEAAVKISPYSAEALSNYGIALNGLQRHVEAIETYDKALALKPDYTDAYNNRGVALTNLQRYEEALTSFDKALALNPKYAEALNNRGRTLNLLKRPEDAAESYRRALVIRPNYIEALNNYANTLRELGRFNEALAAYDQALAIKPDYTTALSNRGLALKDLSCHQEALACFDAAIMIKPDFPEAFNNQGTTLQELRRHEEALASYRKAYEISPQYAEAHFNEGLLRLIRGEFDVGWAKYEWRWKRNDSFQVRDLAQPLWLGKEPLYDKTLLLHAEQGLGDTVQFVRYAPLVAARGATVVLEVQPGLKSLLSGFPGTSAVLAKGEKLPQFDYHCPLLSLPLAFATRLNTIPGNVPYLTASAERIRKWRERLPSGGLRIGLAWSGNPEHKNDHNRSIGLHKLLPLLETDAIFVSLQKEVRAEDQELVHAQRNLLHFGADFTDTAALTSLMDVVISVDTAAAHLAGALAKPLWLLLPFASDWRWLLDRNDSPWYPTAKLFRQPAIGDWQTVVQHVRAELFLLCSHLGQSTAEAARRPDHRNGKPGSRSPKPLPDLTAAFKQALSFHQTGRLGEAEKTYRQILETQPQHFDSLHLLGVVYSQCGRYAEAVRQIDVALKINPKDASAFNNRGIALKELKRLDEALASYDKAIALKPDYAEAFNNRGIALMELKRLDEALASYDKAIALKPDYAEAFNNRGIALKELKRLDEALASYDRAIALKPDYAEAFNNRGIALKELKRLDEALASYDRAIALKPDYATAFNNRGNALQKLKRLDEALASHDKAIALKPDYAEAFNNRSNALRELRRLDEALASYDKAIALKPDYAEAFNNRGNVLQELKRLDEALANYDQAIALKSDYADVFINRGNVRRELKCLNEALASYDQAIADSSPLIDDHLLFENANLRLKQCKHGVMMFYANDSYIGRSLDFYGEFSEGEIEVFKQVARPGMTVVDVGANIGAHTLYFSKVVGHKGRVLAFEPQRVLHQMLCGNVALNACANVTAVNAALGVKSGSVAVPAIDYARGGNFGGLALGERNSGESVPLHTLDSYGLKSCGFIKVDVEGMERDVLEGAKSVLDEHQPVLYVENDRAEKSEALIGWLMSCGYRLYWHLPPLFNAKNYFGRSENVFGKTVSVNMLCIPRSKPINVKDLREITSPEQKWRA